MFVALLGVAQAANLIRVQEPVADSYVVVFHTNSTQELRDVHFRNVARLGVQHKYFGFNTFHGYSASLSKNALSYILSLPEVSYVEENGVMRAYDCDVQKNAPWGVVRSNEKELKTEGDYYFDSDSIGVIVYIIDTGIRITHNDFRGRATWGFNSADTTDQDLNGHGSHVAGTVAGTAYGLAKYANVIAVKVLDASGSGTYAGVIDGMVWACNDYKGRGNRKAGIANMSLGGGKSQAVNDALDACVDTILFVVASGNSNANACNYSPASATKALTVNSVGKTDTKSSWSNFGTCTHIFGPGENILSAWHTSDTATNTISGTSMATPHTCGVGAKIIGESDPLTPTQVKDKVISLSSKGIVKSPGTGSPNNLLYHACTFSQ